MTTAPAALALIDRVDPYWVISMTPDAARSASGESPGPSCPNSSTQRSGISAWSTGTDPATLSMRGSEGMPHPPTPRTRRRFVVAHVLVAVGDHGAAAVPPAAADDVHLGGEERVGAAHDRADVHVVLPVLDRDVEAVAAAVELGDDGVHRPVAELVDDVPRVAVGEQLPVVAGVIGPLLRAARPWADPVREGRLCGLIVGAVSVTGPG